MEYSNFSLTLFVKSSISARLASELNGIYFPTISPVFGDEGVSIYLSTQCGCQLGFVA